jgi:hypothetical protein
MTPITALGSRYGIQGALGGIGKLSEMYPKSVIRYGSYRKVN